MKVKHVFVAYLKILDASIFVQCAIFLFVCNTRLLLVSINVRVASGNSACVIPVVLLTMTAMFIASGVAFLSPTFMKRVITMISNKSMQE